MAISTKDQITEYEAEYRSMLSYIIKTLYAAAKLSNGLFCDDGYTLLKL